MFDPVTLIVFALGIAASFLLTRYVRRRLPKKEKPKPVPSTRQLRRAAERAQKRD